jgi:predicted RNA methylase
MSTPVGWIQALERTLDRAAGWNEPPHDPAALGERLDALDRIEMLLLGDTVDDLSHDIPAELQRRALTTQTKLASLNEALYLRLRQAIGQGAGREVLLGWASGFENSEDAYDESYGPLDELIAGVLQFEQAADVVVEQPADMVFYQPTPARHIFDLIRRAAPDESDVLVDLGAGLGHVPMLFAICTEARGIGIEREASYVDCARHSARTLGLPRVSFVEQDARMADLSRGTLFYLYTPFGGAILRAVLDALRSEASRREIRIATYGPCTQAVLEESWLAVVGTRDTRRIVLFHSSPREAAAKCFPHRT